MSYERPYHRRLPDKQRNKGEGIVNRHKERDKAKPEVVVPYQAVFVKNNGAYSGVASIQVPPGETSRAKYIGWLKVLRDVDGWRNWILPVTQLTENKITVGRLQLGIPRDGVIVPEERCFGEDMQRQLGYLAEFAYKDLLQNTPRTVQATAKLLGCLQARFPQEHTAKIKEGAEVYCLESKLGLPVYELI